MVRLLFVLGCSGSGKSTVSRYISMSVRDRNWSAHFINDYEILYQMFLDDTDCKQFRPADYNGFDVLEMSVYDAALDELNKQVRELTKGARENEIVIIEFARWEYSKALKHFDNDFLLTAHFLFLDVDIKTCKQRILERITQPQSLDDHFVPNDVIECFGQASCKHYIESGFKLDYGINDDRILILDNNGPIEGNAHRIEQFVDTILSVLVPVGS
jgi:gluconate kinase